MRWLWTILAILASVASAEAFTCDDVRALSPEQQAYYIGPSTSRRPSRITFAGSAMDRERTAHPTFQRTGRQVVSHAAGGTKAQLVFPVRTRGHDDSEFVNVKLNAGVGLAAQADAGLPSSGKARASEPSAQQPRGSRKRGRSDPL